MRSLPMCAAWLVLVGVSLGLQSFRTHPMEILFLLFLTIYGTQAFIAEALGIRVNKKSIRFPRRLIPGNPFLILWRMRVKCADIEQISARPKTRVRMQKSTGERLQVNFPSREARLQFFQMVKQADPWISIYGSRLRQRRGRHRHGDPVGHFRRDRPRTRERRAHAGGIRSIP